jgi:hypothetical protein
LRAYLRSSQLIITILGMVFAAVLLGAGHAYAQKEFLIVGTVDCGLPSGRRCSIDEVIRLWTSDVTGERARFVVDVSWVKNQLGTYDQDDAICIEVRAMPDGTLQALGISQTCGRPPPTRRPTQEPRDGRDAQPTATPTPAPVASPHPVDPSADLRISKEGELICPEGCFVSWIVVLTNDGPDTATGVVVEDFYDAEELECEFFTEDGTFFPEANRWLIQTLGVGESATLEVQCFFDSQFEGSGFDNEVEVLASDQKDPDSTPNNDDPEEDDQASDFVPLDRGGWRQPSDEQRLAIR